jgi:hypothetical protein
MGADLGNVSTRFEDTSSSSSSDLGSVGTGVVRVVDKIIGSSVIPRRVVGRENVSVAVDKPISQTEKPLSTEEMKELIEGRGIVPPAIVPPNLAETKKADDGTSDLKRTSGGGGDNWSFALGGFALIVGALGIFVIYKVIKAVKK